MKSKFNKSLAALLVGALIMLFPAITLHADNSGTGSTQNLMAVIVAEGSATNGYLPVYGYYCDTYQVCQMIYSADELGLDSGDVISKLHFFVSLGDNAGRWDNSTFEVRLANTTQTNLSSSFDQTASTLVYTGTLTANTTVGMVVTFDTPFTYTGGNLLIDFRQPNSSNYQDVSFYGKTVAGGGRYRHYSTDITSGGNVQDFLPKCEITYTPAYTPDCISLRKVLPSNITRTSFTATWEHKAVSIPANCIGYEVKLSDSSNPDTTGITSVTINDPTTLSYTFEHLERDSTYYVHARSNCGTTDGYGDWVTCSVTTKALAGCNAIGDSTLQTGMPTSNYGSSYFQQIFTASELTAAGVSAGQINGLTYTWVQSGSTPWAKNMTIYLAHTSNSSFSDSYEWEPGSSFTQYYNNPNMSITEGTMTYTFETPFVWDGTSNIVIAVSMNCLSSNTSYTNFTSLGSDCGATRCRYMISDNHQYGIDPTTESGYSIISRMRPYISFCQTNPPCPAVTNVTVPYSTIDTTSAVVNWNASTGDYANTYDLLLSDSVVTDFSSKTPQFTGLTATSKKLDSLSVSHDYYVYVRVNCNAFGKDDGDAWSEGLHFKTRSLFDTCYAPINVQATDIEKYQATITWTQSQFADSTVRYEMIVSTTPIANPDQQPVDFTDITGQSKTISQLLRNTTYYVYVRGNCGSDHYTEWLSTSFTTLDVTVSYNNVIVANGSSTNSYLPIYGYRMSDPDLRTQFIYPDSMLTSLRGATISSMTFYSNVSSVGYSATMNIYMGTTTTNSLSSGFTTTPSTMVCQASGTLYINSNREMTINFTTPFTYPENGGNLLIEFKMSSSGNSSAASFYGRYTNNASAFVHYYTSNVSQFFLPKVKFYAQLPVDPCPKPTNVNITNITGNSFDINYTNNASTTHFAVTTNGTRHIITTNPATITGLTPGVTYNVAIAALCSSADSSSYVNAGTVTTPCTVLTPPYSESFESMTANQVPACWDNSSSSTQTLSATPANVWGVYQYNGNNMIRMYNYYVQTGSAIIETPQISLTDNTYGYKIAFDYCHQADCGAFTVDVSSDNGVTWRTLGSCYGSSGSNSVPADWHTRTINLSEYTGQTVKFRFNSNANYGNGAIFIDNINIDPLPACADIDSLTINNDHTDATICINDNSVTHTQWEYFLCVAGYDTTALADSLLTTTYSDTIILTGLMPTTTYDIYVRADCGSEHSDWIKGSFTTTDAPASLPYVCHFTDSYENAQWQIMGSVMANKFTIGTSTDACNVGESAALYIANNGIYGYYNNTISQTCAYRLFRFLPSQYDIRFSWKCTGGEGSYDYGRFYLLPASSAPTLPPSGVFNASNWPTNIIPLDGGGKINLTANPEWNDVDIILDMSDQSGYYYLVFNWVNDGSVGSDYPLAINDIEISEITCPMPTDITVPDSTITATTAVVHFSASDSSTFRYWYNTSGNSGDTANVGTTASTSFTLTDLSPSQQHYLYLQSVCSPSDSSPVANTQFTTLCGASNVFPYSEDFEGQFLPYCWSQTSYGTYTNTWSVAYGSSHSGSYSASIPDMQAGAKTGITTSALNFAADGNYMVSLWVYRQASNYQNLTDEALHIYVYDQPVQSVADESAATEIGVINAHYLGTPAESAAGWYEYSFSVPRSCVGSQYVTISYHNQYGTGILFDDLTISEISPCDINPQYLRVVGEVSDQRAAVTWNFNYGIVRYDYELYSGSDATGTLIQSASVINPDTIVFDSLAASSAYFFRVRAFCTDDTTEWSDISFNTTTPIMDIPFICGFESSEPATNAWQFAGSTNQFIIGDDPTYLNSGRGMYVSDDNLHCNYNINTQSNSYAYVLLRFAPGSYHITYDWAAVGEYNYDYARVYLAPSSFVPTGGTMYSGIGTTATPTGWIAIDGGSCLNMDSINAYVSTAVTFTDSVVMNFVVFWHNDNSGGYQTPFAIDNISITRHDPGTIFTDTVCYNESYTEHRFDIPSSELNVGWNTVVDTVSNAVSGQNDIYRMANVYKHADIDSTYYDTICSGQPYIQGRWNITYPTSRTYWTTYPGAAACGCDSTVSLNLTVVGDTPEHIDDTICQGTSYQWHDTTITTDGTYMYTALNRYGCNDTAYLHLTVIQTDFTYYDSIQYGESYFWYGESYNSSGTYTWSGVNYRGCIVTETLVLTVIRYFTIDAQPNDATMGYVTGGGQYNNGDTATLTAIPLSGYRFTHWNTGDTNSVKSFTVFTDSVFTAYFEPVSSENGYLNFVAVGGPATVKLIKTGSPYSINLQYSTDNCTTWNTYSIDQVISLNSGSKVYFKATSTNSNFSKDHSNNYNFVMTGTISANGNIMSLLDATMQQNRVPNYAFICLFKNCTLLTTAPALPASNLSKYCYFSMFDSCTSLTTAPALPAIILANQCYTGMFFYCSALSSAPVLPATYLADGCYSGMFFGCSSLTSVPALPATTLAESCYCGMFQDCSSLTTAPNLSATTLAENCYSCMFQDCSSLTTAPNLSATTLAKNCYSHMFYGCSSLTTPPDLPATSLAEGCYYNMFCGCTSLIVNLNTPGVPWKIPATTAPYGAVDGMFTGTSGTMNGTPTVNTTYYIASDPNVRFTVSAKPNNSSRGTVTGGGQYKLNEVATLTATPKAGCFFTLWSNGETSETINITVTGDVTLTAYFETNASTAVDDVDDEDAVTLVPNPVNAGATAYIYGDLTDVESVEVLNSVGQVIDSFKPESYPVEVSGISSDGIYFVRLRTTDGKVLIRKLVVK